MSSLDDASLSKAEACWRQNEALEAGRLLFEKIRLEDRPAWAISVLKLAHDRSGVISSHLQQLCDIGGNVRDWPKAHAAFSSIRRALLELENSRRLSESQNVLLYQLYLAENVAKVIYNATNPADEFDEDSGWWIAKCLRDYVDYLQDASFENKAWTTLACISP